MNKSYWVYIMASRKNGTIYIGVTGDLRRRAWEHHEGKIAGFTKKYCVKNLVYYAEYAYIQDALERELKLKAWSRSKKLALIENYNPQWEDLRLTL